MQWKLFATVATLTATTGVLLVGCGQSSSSSSNAGNTTAKMAKTQVLNWSENGQDLTTLDPSLATDVISGTMISNSQEGLYRLGKNSKVTPGIATKTTVSKVKKTYTFTLRKNAKWSNGDQETAQDFEYGWRRTVNPKTASQYAYLYSGIKNADKIVSGKAKTSTLGIKADGKYKLTVKLEKPMQYFKLLMGFGPARAHPSRALKKSKCRELRFFDFALYKSDQVGIILAVRNGKAGRGSAFRRRKRRNPA